jgi:hypothetical protein
LRDPLILDASVRRGSRGTASRRTARPQQSEPTAQKAAVGPTNRKLLLSACDLAV